MPSLVINKYEVALFPKEFYTDNTKALAEKIKKNVEPFKNGTYQLIPVPNDAPREIPRIIFRSKNGDIGANISFAKVNIYWTNIKEDKQFSVPIETIQSITEEILRIILEHTGSKTIKRVGYIKEVFFVKNPLEALSDIFKIKKGKLREYIFQLTYDSNILDIKGNRVIAIGSGSKQTGNKDKVVMITSDTNTHQSVDVSWSSEKVREFIEEADKIATKKELFDEYFNA